MEYTREVFENNTMVDAARVLNKFDAALYELFSKMGIEEYIWENEAPTEYFEGQNITIEAVINPKYYEIEFKAESTDNTFRFTTGKIPIEYATQLQVVSSDIVRYRDVAVVLEGTDLTFTFADAGYGSGSKSNKYAVPLRIKVYY